MTYTFPNTILKITTDGRTVASDSLEEGERLVNGQTYDQIVGHEDPPEREIPPLVAQVNPAPSTVLTTDASGVHTQLVDSEGALLTRLLPFEIAAAEQAAVLVSEDAPAKASGSRKSKSAPTEASEPILDAGEKPQA